MKKCTWILFLIGAAVVISGCGPSKSLTVDDQKKVILEESNATLERLYKERPSTKDEIAGAAGYGTFSNGNVNIIFVSAGGGFGVVSDNATGQKTYMKMGLGGVGLGLGVKDYRQVLVFKTKEAMTSFIESGWDFGGNADAAAKAGESGGEMSGEGDLRESITVYSMTESGLALQATVSGVKYWKDKDLN
jgi:lipid-binding SYLF domain-containing protein